jgi:hypothetical protein
MEKLSQGPENNLEKGEDTIVADETGCSQAAAHT